MVSRIDIGPDGGPYVELDEDAGEFIIRVPQDNVSFDGADLNSVGTASVGALEADKTKTGPNAGSNLSQSVIDESVLIARATESSGQPFIIQNHDVSGGDQERKAQQYFYTSSGEMLGALNCRNNLDGSVDFNLYLQENDVFNDPGTLTKILELVPLNSEMNIKELSDLRVRPSIGRAQISAEAADGEDSQIMLGFGSGAGRRWLVRNNGSSDNLEFVDLVNESVRLRIQQNNQFQFYDENGSQIAELDGSGNLEISGSLSEGVTF